MNALKSLVHMEDPPTAEEFHQRCADGHYRWVRRRCKNTRFDINIKDVKGRTGLHFAAWEDQHAVVAVLLQGGAAIDDHAVRYHSLHDNTYLRYFKGHTDAVTSIAMNSTNDCFLTGSADLTVRMWDLRTPKCCAVVWRSIRRNARRQVDLRSSRTTGCSRR